ncbi:MAG: M23 family metallopeptidase [Deferrisomatales bacterium]
MRRVAALAALLAVPFGAWAGLRIEVSPARPGPGEVFAVRVRGDAGGGALSASFGGRSFALWPAGAGDWEGLAAADRDDRPGPRTLEVLRTEGGGARVAGSAAVELGSRDYPVQRLTVDERTVTLSPADQARAEGEAARIRGVLDLRTPSRLWDGPFRVPAEGPVSSPFGVRRVYNGKPRNYHGGLDLAAPRGAPVVAAAAGRVALVGDLFYTGYSVLLDHGLGLVTAYFHVVWLGVAPGLGVAGGEWVGWVGSTGRSTGPHLHWGVYLAGVRADPLTLVLATSGPAGGGENP